MEGFLYDKFYAIEETHWWFAGMRRTFRRLLTDALRAVPNARLLDVGCGTGIVLKEFGHLGKICGLDLAPEAVKYTKRRNPEGAVLQGNLLSLPVASGSVDAVLAFDVIEHIEDDGAAVKEIHRVLSANGVVVVNVPAFASLWGDKDEANHHHRRYNKRMLRNVLEAAGFRIERLTYTNTTLFPMIWCARQLERLRGARWNPEAEYHPSRWVNWTLLQLLYIEERILRRFDFPFGTSVTCVARRSP